MALDPIEHLLATVPEFRGVYEAEASKWDGEPIPGTVICSHIFSESVLEWMNSPQHHDSVIRAFKYIEDLAVDSEERNQELAFYFLEHFSGPRSLYFQTLEFVGPRSEEMLLDIRRPIEEYRLED